MYFFQASYNVKLVVEYIRGVENSLADTLSQKNHHKCLSDMSSAQQVSDTKSTCASAGTPTTRLDILALDKLTITYFTKGLAASTQKSYEGAQNRLLTFYSETGLWPVLPSEKVLLFCSILSLKTSYHQGLSLSSEVFAYCRRSQ